MFNIVRFGRYGTSAAFRENIGCLRTHRPLKVNHRLLSNKHRPLSKEHRPLQATSAAFSNIGRFDIDRFRLLASAAFDSTQAHCRAMTEHCRSMEAITSNHNSKNPFNNPFIFPRIRVLLSLKNIIITRHGLITLVFLV